MRSGRTRLIVSYSEQQLKPFFINEGVDCTMA